MKNADGSVTEAEVAKHEDLKDDWQTVNIGKKPEEPETPEIPQKPKKPSEPEIPTEVPKTGDESNLGLYLLALAGAGTCMILSKRIRKKKKTNSGI